MTSLHQNIICAFPSVLKLYTDIISGLLFCESDRFLRELFEFYELLLLLTVLAVL
jgi:hypothetical protein